LPIDVYPQQDDLSNLNPQQIPGAPSSRSFFARCGIPLLLTRTFYPRQ
jgi:hypothetical protein